MLFNPTDIILVLQYMKTSIASPHSQVFKIQTGDKISLSKHVILPVLL